MSNLSRIKETEKMLKTLGTVDDSTELVFENYRNKILRAYDLYENKYNDVSDDTLCVYVYFNGTYVVTNEDLAYVVYSIEDRNLLENDLSEVKELIIKYRACNDIFLSDKVESIIGDDGKIYLDRSN